MYGKIMNSYPYHCCTNLNKNIVLVPIYVITYKSTSQKPKSFKT